MGGFFSPPSPPPQPRRGALPPQPVAPAGPTRAELEQSEAVSAQQRKRKGRYSTIMTGAEGITGEPLTEKKTLLGG